MTTNKRFHIINDGDNLQKYGIFCKPVVVDNETDKKYILALDLLDLLNTHHEENIKIKSLIDEKIDYLQRKYDFGQEQGFCPMHNIMHSINVLKEIKKEMGWE